MVYSSLSGPKIGLLRGLLEEAGIACEVRNESISTILPGAAFQPEVWILNEDDYGRACEVRDAWRQSPTGQAGLALTQESLAEEGGVLPSKAWRQRQKVWRQQILIPALLWLVVFFFLGGTYTFGASFLFGLATAVWAAIDSSRLQDRGSQLLGLAFKLNRCLRSVRLLPVGPRLYLVFSHATPCEDCAAPFGGPRCESFLLT